MEKLVNKIKFWVFFYLLVKYYINPYEFLYDTIYFEWKNPENFSLEIVWTEQSNQTQRKHI